jgi:hypothetical protein
MMTSQTARVYVSVREPDLKFATLHARIGVACVYAGQARSDALHLHAANPACALGAGTRVRVCRAGESEATGVRYGRVGARSVGRSDFFAFAAGDGSVRWFEAWGDALDLGLVITGSWSTAYFKSLFLHFLI